MGQTILLIDDDKGIIEVIRSILEEHDYNVLSAMDGKAGLDLAQKEEPDLIILDVRMPLMNGYEFMRALKARKMVAGAPMTPVIILTAKEEMEEVFKMEGAKGYLVKPVNPGILVNKIKECLADDA